MATGVNMLAQATKKEPEQPGQEFPKQEQFYGHERDGSGEGIGFDFDANSGKMVAGAPGAPAGQAQFVPTPSTAPAKPADPRPAAQTYQGRRASAPSQNFIEPGGAKQDGHTPNFVDSGKSEEQLKRRMDFVAGGYKSGDFIRGG